jgi:tetratricopeptide (TPR) repeat protein
MTKYNEKEKENVYTSDAAYGEWRKLPDESTYIFDEQHIMRPKGITRNIPVFEVKHHYLPSDWTELSEAQKRGNTLLDPEETDPKILRKARELNPTNVWLAEESIRAIMLKNFNDLKESKKQDESALMEAFQEARDIAGYLANSDQQDAGILFIQGLIEGECAQSENERNMYKRAIDLSPILPEPYWYTALSYSYEIGEKINFDTKIKKEDLDETYNSMVDEALKNYEEANARSFMSAWIPYDYGCELIRWSDDDTMQKNKGVQMIELASMRFPEEISEAIKTELYLNEILDDPRIQSLL